MARKRRNMAGVGESRGAGWDKGYAHVTSVLQDVLAKDGLMYWYGKLGTDEAQRIKNVTAIYGTRAHKIIGNAIFNPMGGGLKVGEFEEFKNRISELNAEIQRRKLVPIELEKNLICDEHGFCGTADGLFVKTLPTEDLGKPTKYEIWDLKTGTKLPFELLLQLSAYAYVIDPTFENIEAFGAYIGRTDTVEKDKKGLDTPLVDFVSYSGTDLKMGWELFKHVLAIYNGKRQFQFSRKRKRKC